MNKCLPRGAGIRLESQPLPTLLSSQPTLQPSTLHEGGGSLVTRPEYVTVSAGGGGAIPHQALHSVTLGPPQTLAMENVPMNLAETKPDPATLTPAPSSAAGPVNNTLDCF